MLERDRTQPPRFTKKYASTLAAGWTAILVLSFFWTVYRSHVTNLEKARIETRTLYELNLVYRRWSALHGGVYVPVTDEYRPNPYLTVPDRDLTTTTGRKLTLVNPAMMTRQVFELLGTQSPLPVINHITSLKYLNPANKPDAWEEEGLRAFERGVKEQSGQIMLNGEPYMRLLSPFKTEAGCLKCHGHQGYRVGDVRGGVSIAVPMRPYLESEDRERRVAAFTHFGLWLVGMGGIVLFSRNIRNKQAALAESEEKYRLLFENNPHPMWVYDLETLAFLTVNDAALRHYGYTREEFLAMTIRDIRPAEDVAALLANVARVAEGLDEAGVWRHRKKDGSLIHVEITSHALSFEGKRAELVMVTDVTERRRLEDQLRHAVKMEAVGRLAGGVAHDFNNILTAIIGYGSLTKMKLKPDDPVMHNIEEIITSAERGAALTQSLLAFSRKQIINPRPVNINNIIGRVGRLLQRLIGEDVKLEIKTADRDLIVFADSGQLEQVLMNLAANARDAMPEGGLLLIETRQAHLDESYIKAHNYGKPGDYALLSVSDTGTGMDAQVLERIFEPFFTTKEVGRGTGLGLSIVYGIVKQNEGYINVYSEPGKGTTFKLYLPLVEPASGEKETQETFEHPEMTRGCETVLVAEDDEPLRRMVSSVLEEFGYRVIGAVDGEDALAKIREHRNDIGLLLLDVIMPKKNGKEVYEEAKGLVPGIKALFASGYTADIVNKKGILDEGMDFLSKPVSPHELLRKVREVLDRK